MSKKIGIQINQDASLAILVKRDSSGLITSGLVVGNTLYQNQFILLKAQPSDLKENPSMGVGLDDMTNDDDELAWKKKIREEFAKDGLDVKSLSIDNGEYLLNADYK
jgi:hypothetical protein